MPGRVSRSTLPQQQHHHLPSVKPSRDASVVTSTKRKVNPKRKNRNLDAFAIAGKTDPERVSVKQYRLGEVEDEEPRRKKQRLQGADEDDDDATQAPGSRRQLKRDSDKDRVDYLSPDGEGEASDSEPYHIGNDGEDEDSDIDSDDAFGSGDEEKFEGFTFRGSRGGKQKKEAKTRNVEREESAEFDLNEDDSAASGSDDNDDDFGDEGVDLATMLDRSGSDEDVESEHVGTGRLQEGSATETKHSINLNGEMSGEEDDFEEAPSEFGEEEGDGQFDMSEDESDDNLERQEKLQQIVSSSKPQEIQAQRSEKEDRKSMLARALAALQSSSTNPTFSREAQRLARSMQSSSKNSKKSDLVSAPLPKRQRDRIDRVAARVETNKTLARWVDTVKHNRRAEHLSFPLPDPHAQDAQGTTRLVSTAQDAPRNELERTIAAILKESGLGATGKRLGEEELEGFEQLQIKKIPLEEVLARRAELRKQRELMFREEVKARRIKKIKSKAYRRVHRKEAQKAQQKERAMLASAGLLGDDLSEDEREANDRRRAEERMGARHRDSKWANSVKSQGRQVWDADARGGMEEMARRDEELRRRMDGSGEERHEMDSELSSSEDDSEGGFRGEDERRRLQKQLGRIEADPDREHSKLGQLKFMQRADAARKKQNEEDSLRLQRALAGEDSQDDDDITSEPDTAIGRKLFGPFEERQESAKVDKERAEVEGLEDSEDARDHDGDFENTRKELLDSVPGVNGLQREQDRDSDPPKKLQTAASTKTFKPQVQVVHNMEALPQIVKYTEASLKLKQEGKAPNTEGWTTVSIPNEPNALSLEQHEQEDELSSEGATLEVVLPSNYDLVQSAFGTGDDEAAFAAEKALAASSEDEKYEDNALPGWGSWAGEGISKRERKRIEARNKGRFLTKIAEGVRANERKDRDMDRVIVSEKRSRKNAKYLASQLPHPFESKIQYERGIRLPIGPEWSTKETFQSQTKPRILVKPGRPIRPMEQPIL